MLIKQILYKILGIRNYLLVISRLFYISYSIGLLKGNKTFDCHYFIRKVIKKGDYIIDIGANLGYYSRLFAKLAGPAGRVYSVEPVTLFRKILKINLNGYKNVEIVPFALGEENDKSIMMGIPKSNKYLRHGLTRVLKGKELNPLEYVFQERMYTPETLFGNITQCDYIKCDVEGYEIHIVPQIGFLLDRFSPILQIEIDPLNLQSIVEFLANKSYIAYFLRDERLKLFSGTEINLSGDLFFIPPQRIKLIEKYL